MLRCPYSPMFAKLQAALRLLASYGPKSFSNFQIICIMVEQKVVGLAI